MVIPHSLPGLHTKGPNAMTGNFLFRDSSLPPDDRVADPASRPEPGMPEWLESILAPAGGKTGHAG